MTRTALIVLTLASCARGSGPDVPAITAAFESRLTQAAGVVEARALALSTNRRLSYAVATDEETALDLSAADLALRPQADESLEVGQVWNDGRVVTLWSAHLVAPLPLASTGRHWLVRDGRLYAVAVASVVPRQRGDELRGAVAVARTVDLAPLQALLVRLGVRVKLEAEGGFLSLGATTTAKPVPLPLQAPAAAGVRLTLL